MTSAPTTTADQPRPDRRGPFSPVVIAALVAVVVGVVVVAVVLLRQQPAPPAPDAQAARTTSAPAGTTAAGPATTPTDDPPSQASESPTETSQPDRPMVLAESPPTRISIPSIEVDDGFVPLGLTATSELEVPTEAADVGWFTGAHTPGARGVAVVAGHVTWGGGPAVFFRLGELAAGDTVEVAREDGSTAIFEVRDLGTFPKDTFPTDEVYRASEGSELVLITCGGEYADSSYDSNVIVWADLVDSRPA